MTATGPGVTLGVRMQVVPGAENRFVIPVVAQEKAGFESEGMGPDQTTGAPGDPVPLAITGVCKGMFVRWRAIPLSGQDTGTPASGEAQPGKWNTRLDPGKWRILGKADGGIGFVHAGDIDVSASTDPIITMPHFMDYPTTHNGFLCPAKPLCSLGDAATGLILLLSQGYCTDTPLFMETAGGVRADALSLGVFQTGDGTDELIAYLNPPQWLKSNGTCTTTEVGPLCTFAGVSPAQADAARVIGASVILGALRATPATPRAVGIPLTNAPADLFDQLAPM